MATVPMPDSTPSVSEPIVPSEAPMPDAPQPEFEMPAPDTDMPDPGTQQIGFAIPNAKEA